MTPAKDYTGSVDEPAAGQSLIPGLGLTQTLNLNIGFKILIADSMQGQGHLGTQIDL